MLSLKFSRHDTCLPVEHLDVSVRRSVDVVGVGQHPQRVTPTPHVLLLPVVDDGDAWDHEHLPEGECSTRLGS